MNILLVKDNIGDIYMVQSAIEEAGINCQINTLNNSDIAVAHIRQYEDSTVPDIIIVGITLIKDEGLEIVEEIKKNEKLKNIPVIVFTTSDLNKDTSMDYSTVSFITKPQSFQDYKQKVDYIVNLLTS